MTATGPRLLGLCGSLRSGSLNRRLLREALCRWPGPTGEAELDFELYNGDVEEALGLPQEVATLVRQIAEADALAIAGPEYNKGISGVLKNALDWVSRAKPNPLAGKPVAIMSATAGRSGGERAQVMMRNCLQPLRARVLPGPDVLVGNAADAFDEGGRLNNARYARAVDNLMAALLEEVQRCGLGSASSMRLPSGSRK